MQRKHIFDKPARWDWELILKQFTVKGHNWVSLTYCDFNSYLVTTRLVQKFKTTGWLQGHLSLSSFPDWLEFLVKSKLSHSGSVEPWDSCTSSTKTGLKVLYLEVFQIAVRGWGELELLLGEIFLPGKGNLRRSEFDDSNFFQC